jgi:hypothetical protein
MVKWTLARESSRLSPTLAENCDFGKIRRCFLGSGAIGEESMSFYHEKINIGISAREKYVVLLYF